MYCDVVNNNLFGNTFTGYCVLPTQCPTNYYGDTFTTYC